MLAAFSKIGPCVELLSEGLPNPAAIELARQHKPDLIWAQIQRNGWQDWARGLRAAAGPDCTMVTWNGDVRTDVSQDLEPWIITLAESFDLLLADNCTYPKKLANNAICSGYQCHGFESEIVWEPDAEETGGAVFIGANYTQLDSGERSALFNFVEGSLPGLLTLYGTGWKNHRGGSGPAEISVAGQIMRRAAVTITKSLFNNLERYTSNRLKYAFAAGAVTAVERFTDMGGLGLVPGHNCLVWSTREELVDLLRDWTRPERAQDRQNIRERARALAVERFTWDRSVEELLAIVRDYRARRGQPC
jgi:hypothetical protein